MSALSRVKRFDASFFQPKEEYFKAENLVIGPSKGVEEGSAIETELMGFSDTQGLANQAIKFEPDVVNAMLERERECADTFDLLDTSGDGYIQFEEILKFAQENSTASDLVQFQAYGDWKDIRDVTEQIWFKADLNRDYTIDFGEFVAFHNALMDMNKHHKTTPRPKELVDMSYACFRLWHVDDARIPKSCFRMNLGQKLQEDASDLMVRSSTRYPPLFDLSGCDKDALGWWVYATFREMMGQFESEAGKKEVMDQDYENARRRYMDAVMSTNPMQWVFKFLVAHGKIPEDKKHFKRILESAWFDTFSPGKAAVAGKVNTNRRMAYSTSGFEQTFLGERRSGDVLGEMHWLRFLEEEQNGGLQYNGYFGDPKPDDTLFQVQYSWNGATKTRGTLLVGPSPSFQMALYSLLHFMGIEEVDCRLGTQDVKVRVNSQIVKNQNIITMGSIQLR